MLKFKKAWNNSYFKTAVVIALVIGLVLGIFLGVRLALNTDVPVRVVESGSMSLPLNFISGAPYSFNDFLLTLQHPFDRTLDTGDIILVQGVKAADLNVNYPNSDIIIYKNPLDSTRPPIVHRIAAVQNINGTIYYQTKGDGNGYTQYPEQPSENEWDSNSIWHTGVGVTADAIEGKVVMRIPWFGWVALIMQQTSWGLPLVVALIILLVVVEFVIPILKSKKPDQTNDQKQPEISYQI